ncbi:uncharacterized protein LOC117336811 [Pecten maximus]|uniref:uncharacterized protein LOC117336811 n=1 Tax=Pecten maximus TaxID=6579 RepID=UPI0014587C06|nr:uncharacterized protein LOC117336811 [Pecten maximus]
MYLSEMRCGTNLLSLWILCYCCVLGSTETISDSQEKEKIHIPERQKRTTDGGQLPPLPMTHQSGSVPVDRRGQASYDYQHGGATFDTSGTHQVNTRRDPEDDEIRTRMVFNTDNYDVIAETGESTYTPHTYPSTGNTGSTSQGSQSRDGSRTTVTQYYVTREGTAQRLGTHAEEGTGTSDTGSTQYDSGVQVQYTSNQQTGDPMTQRGQSQTNQRHDQTTRRRQGYGQTTQGQTNYNYNTGSRTNSGRNPVYNTGTQSTRVGSNTPVYTTGTQTNPQYSQYPTNTGTSYTTETRTTQTQTHYPYQTGTSYTTSGRGGGYSSLGQVFNLNNNPQYSNYNNRRVTNQGGYISGTSSVPNTGIISDDPNCPTSSYRVYINNMECSRAVDTLGSFICYNYERVSRDCCEKCLSIKRPSNIGCEYGDRSYQCRNMEPFDCYAPRNRQICCDKCSRYELQINTGITGCQYGDLTPRCQIVSERRHLCYLPENQRLCCQTCPRLEDRSNPSCKWGDQNPQLCEPFTSDNQLRVNCYQTSVRQVCCSTCERLKVKDTCEYPRLPVW